MRFFRFWLIAWCCLCCFSCSLQRKTTRQHSLFRTDSLHILRNDSMIVSQLINRMLQQKSRLKQITLSPPDSTGRQWTESITLLSTETSVQTEEDRTGVRQTESRVWRKEAEVVKEEVKREAPKDGRLVAIGLIVLGILFLINRKRLN